MSLNKFTDPERGKALGLKIGCEVLDCTNCVCESMTFPAGGDLNAHDVIVSNNLKVATSNGDVNYTTPDKGQPNYSLHTDGAGNTFWSPDDTGSADLTYNGTIPVALGQHVRFSNTDTSTVNESKLIEDATDLNVQGLNLTNVGLINGAVFPDITDLNSKTQNISLADTVPNTTVLSGRVLSDTMFYDDVSENAIFTSGVGGLVPANFRHTSFGVGAGISADLSCNFGYQAGQTNQGSTSVAIGVQAGQSNQGNQCVAIGEGSGKTNQGNKCVSVGDGSGSSNQGANSIAIGYNAGGSFQPADSIILNATGGTTNNTATNQIRMKAGTTDLIAEGNDLSLGGVNLTNKLNNVESKTQNIDLAGTVLNTTLVNGVLKTTGTIIPSFNVKFGDTSTVDMRPVGDNRVALSNFTPTGSAPILAVFNGSATDGVAASVQVAKNGAGNNGCQLQYRLDALTPANNHACLVVQGGVACALELYQDGRAIFEGTNVQMSSATINGNLEVPTINNLTPVGGFFSQITNIAVDSLANPPTEQVMIADTGVGARIVPADAFIVGGTYRVSQGGFLTCVNNAQLTIRIYGGPTGTTLLGSLPTLTIPTSSNQWFGIESYFVVRSLGGAGAGGVISARAVYTANADNQNAVYGQSFHTINSSLFDSTQPNKLQLTAQWGAQNDGTITTTQATFHRIF